MPLQDFGLEYAELAEKGLLANQKGLFGFFLIPLIVWAFGYSPRVYCFNT